MRTRLTISGWLIELSASAVIIALFAFGKISLAIALVGIALCLSITLPAKRKKLTKANK